MKKSLAIFEGHEIRRLFDEKTETGVFSIVDIIRVLTQQPSYQLARNYWKVLKIRLHKEGSQLVTNCNQLKMAADDGKQRLTDVAHAETLLRLVQSVPSGSTRKISNDVFGRTGSPLPAVRALLPCCENAAAKGLAALPEDSRHAVAKLGCHTTSSGRQRPLLQIGRARWARRDLSAIFARAVLRAPEDSP